MNGLAFAAAAALPAPVLIPLNFDGMYGYYAYRLPVAGSTVEFAWMSYMTAEEEDWGYSLDSHYGAYRPFARFHVSDNLVGPVTQPLVAEIGRLDNQTIRVDFHDNNYTVWQYDGEVYQTSNPIPRFSHSETIRVNQTFVTLCRSDDPPLIEEGVDYDSTGLLIIQYKGLGTRTVSEVEEYMPAAEGVTDDWTGRAYRAEGVYATRTVQLDPPREIPVYKLLIVSAYTDGKMRCDYPQVIEHTIDSKRIGPADVKAMSDELYEWYR